MTSTGGAKGSQEALLSLVVMPGLGDSDKRPAWGDTMMQVALVEACASQVAIKLMHGMGRRTQGTKHSLVSLKASCCFATKCEV